MVRRGDQIGLDLRAALPDWASRALRIPGYASLADVERAVRASEAPGAANARRPAPSSAGSDQNAPSRDPAGEHRSARRTTARGAARCLPPDPSLLATVREAAAQAFGYAPFRPQLVAASALYAGIAIEMDTGEGKTLAGALAAAMHARGGRRVHVLSVNDYLARRDAQWMSPLFERLGIAVSAVTQESSPDERRAAYRAGVVYAPVSEVGYDALRDGQAIARADRVDPSFDVAIVDEADAVMIDEAMTPLVLAGSTDDASDDLTAATELVRGLSPGRDYAVDDDHATVSLTDAGYDALEERLGGVNLFDDEHSPLLTRINLALHALALVERDVDYLVDDGRIRLVNGARGRIAHRQRWPDGLHAAIEAKEGIAVTPPGEILDQITVQDLLLRYETLAGMSGTILPIADELDEFYRLRSARVERRLPNIRRDEPMVVLANADAKRAAIVAEVLARHESGQPVLVGTQSVAESEDLARALPDAVGARILNARNDADEAAIIASAGEAGAVTVSTQMSGRGTDIRLGGPDEEHRERVVAAGGLAVIQSGLYPSTRLDRQLRGRAGRQGDPGCTVTFAALDDDLVRATAPRHRSDGRATLLDAQRIAEAVRLDRHRATWQYTRAIADQRRKVLDVRETALDGGSARSLLTLFAIDERWRDHLALLTEVRDGIHLRVLAGQNPADEFHRIALREFDGFFERVEADVDAALDRLHDGADPLDALGRRRPSATWTYMIRDSPLGDPASRAAAGIRRLVRRVGGG